MIQGIQLALAVMGVAREIFRYMTKKVESKSERTAKVREFKKTLREANKNGTNSESIDRAFSDLKLLDK